MALPSNSKQMSSVSVQNQLLRAGAPVTLNILKERLKSTGTSGNSSQKENQNQSPFVSSHYGHHGFHPQKLGKGPSAETRVPKPPKPPEKPLMPYMRYSRKVWDQVKAQNPELKLWETGKIIGQMWRDLPSDNKSEFVAEYETEKVEHEKNLKSYYNSPAYLAYIAAKTKGKSGELCVLTTLRKNEDKNVMEFSKSHYIHSMSLNDNGQYQNAFNVKELPADTLAPSVGKSWAQQTGEDRDSQDRSTAGSKQDRRIEIQPAEDDDDAEEAYSIKHISYARYLRNHHLIHEIFSDAVVPDVRTVVTTSRMQHFYCKIQSLKVHQKKMESEVEQLVEKFETTKRKLNEASDAFQEEIQKYCKRAVDEEYFNEMVEKEYERLRQERLSTNNNITLDESKNDTSQSTTTLSCDPSPDSTEVFPAPPVGSSLVEEVAIEAKNGDNQSDQANKDTFLAPPIPAATTFQGSTLYSTHPHLNFASGCNQTNCTAYQNQMPPPSSVQPFFTPSHSFSNSPKTQYPYTQGLPSFGASQNSHSCCPPFPYQQHHLSIARPTQQHGSLAEFQVAPHSENQDDSEDILSSIFPE